MKIKLLLSLYLIVSTLAPAVQLGFGALSAAAAMERVDILHQPPLPEELPAVGLPITLKFSLGSTRNTSLPVRALITHDNTLLEWPVTTLSFDQQERPSFEIRIPAPQAGMSYRIVVYAEGGGVVARQTYTINRTCRSNGELTSATATLPGDVQKLFVEAAELERDIGRYRLAVEMLEEIKKSVGN